MLNGLIISSSDSDGGPYRYKVLELDTPEGEDPYKVRFIHESAFKVPEGVTEMVERKNLQRRLDMPLLYGDFITWNEEDVLDEEAKPITKFKRDKTLYEARATGHGCEILLRGAINPDDRLHIYTNMFKRLRLPVDELQTAVPNVFYNCWVEIKPSYDTCTVIFAEFDSICDIVTQEDLITLPWNITNNTYRTHISMDSDSDDGHPWLIDNSIKGPAPELIGKAAFVSGARTFFCGEHPAKIFIIPILHRNDVAAKIGNQLKIDAIYNRFEDLYLVSKIHIPLTVISAPTDNQGRLRCSVRLTHILGVFYNKELGFLDDPDGKLALLHLTKYADRSFQVAVVDFGPSHSALGRFRFRIVDMVDTVKDCRIQKWLSDCSVNNEPMILSNEIGTVVSQTCVFCPKHATLLFWLPKDVEISPGKMVEFTAHFDIEKDEFAITTMAYLPNIALNYVIRRMFEHSPYEKQYIFQITRARLPNRDDIPPLLYCDHFGYLDDLGLIKEIKKNKQYSVWVMMSSPDFKDAYRPGRVAWEVVSASSKEPIDRITAQCGTRIMDKVQGELMESGSESCFSNWSEPLTVYSEQKPPSMYKPKFAEDDSTLRDEMSEGRSSHLRHLLANSRKATRKQPTGLPSVSDRIRTISGGTNMSLSMGDTGSCSTYRQSRAMGSYNGATDDGDSIVTGSGRSNYEVQLIIDQINRYAHDDQCDTKCVHGCPFLKELASHIVKTPNFWSECQRYPPLASAVSKKMKFA